MRGVVVLTIVLAGIVAMPDRASAAPARSPVTGLVQAADPNGDGWALCWQRGAKLSFWCPVYPRYAPIAARASWWAVAKCAVAIAAFIAYNYVAWAKIKKLGGAWKAAKRFLKAKKEERGRRSSRSSATWP